MSSRKLSQRYHSFQCSRVKAAVEQISLVHAPNCVTLPLCFQAVLELLAGHQLGAAAAVAASAGDVRLATLVAAAGGTASAQQEIDAQLKVCKGGGVAQSCILHWHEGSISSSGLLLDGSWQARREMEGGVQVHHRQLRDHVVCLSLDDQLGQKLSGCWHVGRVGWTGL